MEIKKEKPAREYLDKRGVGSWPVWQKEASRFDWHYDATEECYILEGRVVVETEDGKSVEIEKGDFVTFPKGLACGDIKEPISKHYNFP